MLILVDGKSYDIQPEVEYKYSAAAGDWPILDQEGKPKIVRSAEELVNSGEAERMIRNWERFLSSYEGNRAMMEVRNVANAQKSLENIFIMRQS
jgi:hypothetical protein